MSQTDYSLTMAAAFAGMIADDGPTDIASALSEEASAEIPFGVFVAKGAVERTCELPDASTDLLEGVVVASQRYEPGVGGNIGTTGIKPKGPVNVMRSGRVYVKVEEAVVVGDRPHVRYASGAGGTQLGGVRKSAVSMETIDASTQGVFRTAAGAGGFAVLELDMTAKPA